MLIGCRCPRCGLNVARNGCSMKRHRCPPKQVPTSRKGEVMMKRPEAQAAPTGPDSVFSDSLFRQEYPMLSDYLTEDKWEDGQPRQTSTLMFCIEEGSWRGCLNDRACERSLWRSGACMEDCLAGLENALMGGTSDWRSWRKGQGSKNRRR